MTLSGGTKVTKILVEKKIYSEENLSDEKFFSFILLSENVCRIVFWSLQVGARLSLLFHKEPQQLIRI